MHRAGLGLCFDERDQPRLRVECTMQPTATCRGQQTIACSEEWRLPQPIPRADRLYHDLLQANKNKEGLFHHRRRRYGVPGNDFAERPRRRQPVTCRALRAAAGLLVEWLRICLRHGWLGSHRRSNETEPVERIAGRGIWEQVHRTRRDLDLNVPYGPAARALGYATNGLGPGERARLARSTGSTEEPGDGLPFGAPDHIPFWSSPPGPPDSSQLKPTTRQLRRARRQPEPGRAGSRRGRWRAEMRPRQDRYLASAASARPAGPSSWKQSKYRPERRGRDSNPRSGFAGLQFSRLAHSTALPPLRGRRVDASRTYAPVRPDQALDWPVSVPERWPSG
jgi:hypothetical protein